MLKDNKRISEEDIIELKSVLKKFSFIQVTYLFGSQVKGRITPLSDIDIAVLTERKLSVDEKAEIYWEIATAFHTDKVDIVFLNEVTSDSLKFRVIKEGVPIFIKNEKHRIKFEEEVMADYWISKPIIEEYDKYFFKKVKELGR